MKNLIITSVIAFLIPFNQSNAQYGYASTELNYQQYDLSDNLDLEAVSYIFAKSRNLKTFEYALNSPEYRLSNLDIDRNGYIDYLRVVESPMNGYSVVFIQALLGHNIVQDVATIEVRYLRNGGISFQVIGDEYLFGHNYIVEPVIYSRPTIAGYFHVYSRHAWHSPYDWDYFPTYYKYRRPLDVFYYHRDVSRRFNVTFVFSYPAKRYFHHQRHNFDRFHRHDYAKHHKDYAFEYRNKGFRNKHDRREKYDRNRRNTIHNGRNSDYRTNNTVNRKSQDNRINSGYDSGRRRDANSNVRIGNEGQDQRLKSRRPSESRKRVQNSVDRQINQKSSNDQRNVRINRSQNSKSVTTNKNNSRRNSNRYSTGNTTRERSGITQRNQNSKSVSTSINSRRSSDRYNSGNRQNLKQSNKKENTSYSNANARRNRSPEASAKKSKVEKREIVKKGELTRR